MSACRIHPDAPLPAPEVLEQLRKLPSCVVSDQLERSGFAQGIRQITRPELGLAGRAFTVRTRPGDNLVIYKAVELAAEGDVLVIDAGGATDRAVMGGIFFSHVVARGIGGLVIDGAIRDIEELADGPIPVFARATAHLAPYKDGPGELRGPIAIGGAVVAHGDFVVGDADGVAVVPAARVGATIEGGLALLEEEKVKQATAAAGEMDTAWLDEALDIEWVGSAEESTG